MPSMSRVFAGCEAQIIEFVKQLFNFYLKTNFTGEFLTLFKVLSLKPKKILAMTK